MEQVVVKSNCDGDIRRITVDTGIEFYNLVEILRQLYSKPACECQIQWKDSEGDMILVTTDLELHDAFRVVSQEGTSPVLRLTVRFSEPMVPEPENTGESGIPNDEKMEMEQEETPSAPPQPSEFPGFPGMGDGNAPIDWATWGQMGLQMVRQYWPGIEQHLKQWQQQFNECDASGQPGPCPPFWERGGRRGRRGHGGWRGRGRGGAPSCPPGPFSQCPPHMHPHPPPPAHSANAPVPPWRHWYQWFKQFQEGSGNTDDSSLNARFVKHETLFDGTEVQANSDCVKIWRIRNEGTVPWPANTKLVWVSGDLLSADGKGSNVPEAGVGEEVDVALGLRIPPRTGRYVSLWRLVAPWGVRFGQELKIDVLVVPESDAPQVRLDGQPDSAFVRNGELTPDEIAAAVEEIDMAAETMSPKPLGQKKKD